MRSTIIETLKVVRVTVPCMAIVLLSGCGGGSGGVTTYKVSATAGTGGSISPSSATVDAGATTTLTIAPNSGYAISGVTGCNGALSGNTYTTGTINSNCSVTASFVAQYTATATAGTGGTISPSSATVNAGATTTFTVTPNGGYVISSVTGCGGMLSGNTYTTGTINASCTVVASLVATWTWMGGSDKADAPGVYGSQGMAATSNMPGAHWGSDTWTDAGGNLWMFGGSGNDSLGTRGDLNDLWKYSTASGEWTWMGGSNVVNQMGVYGTQGVPGTPNIPGARFGSGTWRDASGNLWLFGGWGYDSAGTQGGLSDLWKYSSASGEWTWMNGSSTANATGVYGTQGVPAASNMPGPRNGAVTWVDASGYLWLFGGRSDQAQALSGYWNDLWKYSPQSGEWTWIGGSNAEDQNGVYGTQGVAAASNMPGARSNAIVWMDANGNVWLFGGWGHDSAGNVGDLNDLWEYSPGSGLWTWVGGSNSENQKGVYGTQGVAAASNMPGARNAEVAWVDAHGSLWLFGGYGNDSTGAGGFLSDLWEYSPGSGEWTWISGPTVADQWGVYGTQAVAAASNMPGARCCGTMWTDVNGNLWLFGGAGYDAAGTQDGLNDLWKYPIQ